MDCRGAITFGLVLVVTSHLLLCKSAVVHISHADWRIMASIKSSSVATDTEKNLLDLKTFYEIALLNRPFLTSFDVRACNAIMSEIDAALRACRSGNLQLTMEKLSRARGLFEHDVLNMYKDPYTGTAWKLHYWQAVKLGMKAKMDQYLKDSQAILSPATPNISSVSPSISGARPSEMDGLLTLSR